jgi:hypothetical protein
MPQRLQRKHYRERMPPGSIGVARPSSFDNKFDGETYGPPEVRVRLCKAKYEHDSASQAQVRQRLRGTDLWCSCALDAPCHADVPV